MKSPFPLAIILVATFLLTGCLSTRTDSQPLPLSAPITSVPTSTASDSEDDLLLQLDADSDVDLESDLLQLEKDLQ